MGSHQVFAPKNSRDRVYGVQRWLQWLARFPGLNARARLAALELAGYESMPQGVAYPSLETLARDLGCSPSAARAAIRQLEEVGIVQRVARFRGREQTSNEYRIIRRPGGEGRADERGPVAISESTPSRSREGKQEIRSAESSNQENNSTRARERATRPPARAVLPFQVPSELLQKLDGELLGSLLTALRRPECSECPEAAAKALAQLARAGDVRNPAGYFLRVFREERLAPPTPPEVAIGKSAAPTSPVAALRAKLSRLVQRLEHLQQFPGNAETVSKLERMRVELAEQIRNQSAPTRTLIINPDPEPEQPWPAPRTETNPSELHATMDELFQRIESNSTPSNASTSAPAGPPSRLCA
jgi:hypothetical protein